MKSYRNYSLIASIFLSLALIFAGQSLAGDIDAKLPDNDDTSSFQVKDSSDNVLMKVQSGGNVGIGSSTPDTYLEIAGTPVTDKGLLKLTDTTGDDPLISFYAGDTSYRSYIGYSQGAARWGTRDGSFLFVEGGPLIVEYTGSVDSLELRGGGLGAWQVFSDAAGDLTIYQTNVFQKLMIQNATGNVGIGTDSPSMKLDVVGNQIRLRESESASAKEIMLRTDGAEVDLDVNNANLFIKSNTGNTIIQPFGNSVGIGTTAPTQKLDVNGNARFRSVGSGGYNRALNLTLDGTLTIATSDCRLKTKIENIKDGLKIVKQLQGIRFNWKDDPEGERRIGLVAQDVEEVLPELTYTNPADGYMGINYAELTAVLIEAVKDQQKTISELNARIAELDRVKDKQMAALKLELAHLQDKMKEIMIQQISISSNNSLLSRKK